mgnify:CR=1 FL=1
MIYYRIKAYYKKSYGGDFVLERKFKELVTFYNGVNTTRAESQLGITSDVKYYDQKSFEADYYYKSVEGEIPPIKAPKDDNNLFLKVGDVVISNTLNLATIIKENNANKLLTHNFTKVEFKGNELNKEYFIYLFNENKYIKRQKERKRQGSSILKIPTRILEDVSAPVIPLDEQVKVGGIYTEVLKLKGKLEDYSCLMEQITSRLLEKAVEGANIHD